MNELMDGWMDYSYIINGIVYRIDCYNFAVLYGQKMGG